MLLTHNNMKNEADGGLDEEWVEKFHWEKYCMDEQYTWYMIWVDVIIFLILMAQIQGVM